MSKIEIYTTTYCPYCIRAKLLLDSKSVSYKEINFDNNPEEKYEIMSKLNWRTVPIIVINGQLIGGYDQLVALERSKELDSLLK